jgi:Cu(I)/Ag(I) efflux system periplasmic protein CusF
MKTVIATALIALSATFSVPSIAAGMAGMPGMSASEHEGHGAMAQSKAPTDTQLVEGTVKKVDKAAGKVTLAHGPLTNLGMTMGMTMAFRVKDAAWLDQMKEGDKIRFLADNANGVYTVVKYEPVK